MNESIQKSKILPLIRTLVKERLMASAAYNDLDAERRAQVAHDTVNALHYILGGEDGSFRPTAVTLGGNAQAFAGQPQVPRSGAGAAEAGTDAYTRLVEGVNFPAFVGGLIDGVFNSIVTTSIKQMEAYAEMVRNVSKSVDQYMKDNVSEDHARDFLAEKYPDHLEIDAGGEAPRLKPKEGLDDGNMPDFMKDLGLPANPTSLDEDFVEEQLVPAARARIAMDRQQLLATMVMMGINRLVVTNGTIEASCFFELDTTDMRKSKDTVRREDSRDRTATGERYSGSEQSWNRGRDDRNKSEGKGNWYSKSNYSDIAKFNMVTASTRDSEQTLKMHAELGGKVKVNFKSDFFPMEKMIDVLQVNQIREKSAAGIAPPTTSSAPAPSLPALPPMPALPAAPAQPK